MNTSTPMQSMSSDSVSSLAKAMVKVHKAITPASRDRMNPFTRSMYATLGSVMDSCRAALLDAGVWMTQYPVPVEGVETWNAVGLVTKLVHAESGEWQSSLLVMPVSKNDPQGFGSALTYARRYALSAMVGIVTEDDDGNAACTAPGEASREQPSPLVKPLANGPVARSESMNAGTPMPPVDPPELPKIDGVAYSQARSQDGMLYVTAIGDTRSKTALLKEAGFRWDSSRKTWWRYMQQAAG